MCVWYQGQRRAPTLGGPRYSQETATGSDAHEVYALARGNCAHRVRQPAGDRLLLRERTNAGAAGCPRPEVAAAVRLRGNQAMGSERLPAMRFEQHASEPVYRGPRHATKPPP